MLPILTMESINNDIELTEQKSEEFNLQTDLSYSSRHNFVKKVYSILTSIYNHYLVQLAITVAFCVTAYKVEAFLQFQIDYPILLWLSVIALLVIEVAILCTSLGKKFPINTLLLLAFTLCESYIVSFICSSKAKE